MRLMAIVVNRGGHLRCCRKVMMMKGIVESSLVWMSQLSMSNVY